MKKVGGVLLSGGIPPINLPVDVGDATKQYGLSIDVYDVTSRNCTTHTINALKAGGTEIFKKNLSLSDSIPGIIQYFDSGQESIVVPLTLEEYMVGKKHDLSSLVVVEVTDLFKEQYLNFENITPIEKSKKMLLHETATTAASLLGHLTDISAEGLNGAIGEWFYKRNGQ
ncbi:hypothetical protein AB7Y49_05370 [Providencia vermicola]|uniref:Uncharacterized protein n=1 Tax=Providencia vermicola TaxID=333965 RepID=A0AAX3RW45_9GAMM|nr:MULTISPECIES: hypothetical protein [Providencia]ELX8378053.1 hypothetical protein [Providencia stuartii]EMD5259507.1 hypothetical protein [Providencia stuartii]USB36033.1 hypothetical protein M5J11_14600 [Providencia vermicola]WFC05135.1 hypothetical protein PG365_10295 [Providencia vermicola]